LMCPTMVKPVIVAARHEIPSSAWTLGSWVQISRKA
jgi:hypothetical protein